MSGDRFRVEIDSTKLAAAIEKAAAKKTAKMLNDISSEIEDEVDRLMGTQLVTDRSGDRRKKGSRHAVGSTEIVIEGDSFPFTISGRSRAASAKMAALEYGADPHWINARNVPNLVFPRTVGRSVSTSGGSLVRTESGRRPSARARQAGGGRTLGGSGQVRTPSVWHPGNRPYGFIQKAIENVISRRFR